MRYRIVEELEDGRSYCVIERDDGSTFGQIVDLRDATTDQEVDDLVTAKVVESEERNSRPTPGRVSRVGLDRPITPPTRGAQ